MRFLTTKNNLTSMQSIPCNQKIQNQALKCYKENVLHIKRDQDKVTKDFHEVQWSKLDDRNNILKEKPKDKPRIK